MMIRKTTKMGPQIDFCDQLHAMKYRQSGETFRDAMNRVAMAMADPGDSRHYHEFRDALLSMRFSPAGRIQAAMGSSRDVTPFNCYASGAIPDSFVSRDNPDNSSIMHRAEEAASTMRMGGGIGYDFSTLRPRGALIKKLQSNSSGPIAFMHIYDAVCGATASAGHRRGAQMGVLRIDHPDILEFINVKHKKGVLEGFNLSIGVTDLFMESVIADRKFDLEFGGDIYNTVMARELWEAVMRSTWDWAEPGVLFIDTINRMNNLYYCEKIATTNPCFTGDTKVWTDRGHRKFSDLVGKTVNVLTQDDDGKLIYRPMSSIRVTQRDAKLVRVKFTDGSSVRVTPQHKFFLKSGEEVEAGALQAGFSVQSVYRYKANQKGYLRLTNGVSTPLEHHVPFEDGVPDGYLVHHRDEVKTHNWRENLELKLWGQHSADHMTGERNPSVRYPERNWINSHDHSHDGNGRWRHDLSTQAILEDRESGMSHGQIAKKHGCSKHTVGKRLAMANHTVASVEILDYVEDVYCGSVEDTHRFFIALGDNDGVLVRNCGEQPLPPFGACLLGSFNLVRYLSAQGAFRYSFDFDLLRHDIPHIVRAMDNVIDGARFPLEAQRIEAVSKRRMGLGIMGLANAAETLGFTYGSPSFLEFEAQVLDTIRDESYLASALLAREKGPFALYDEERYMDGEFIKTLSQDIRDAIRFHGIRNSHLTSIAPTGTIAMTADNVSPSAEPVFDEWQERPVNTPDGPVIVQLQDYASANFGTRPKLTKDVTAAEHVAVLTTAARRVDSAVSKTCNVTGKMPWDEFKNIYMQVWEGGGKGCTTFNEDGERAGLLKKSVKKTENDSCTFDPKTGTRSCE